MKKSDRLVVIGRRELPTVDGSGSIEVTLIKLPAFTKSFKKQIIDIRDRETAAAKRFARD